MWEIECPNGKWNHIQDLQYPLKPIVNYEMLPIIGVTILLEVGKMCYAQMKSYMCISEYT